MLKQILIALLANCLLLAQDVSPVAAIQVDCKSSRGPSEQEVNSAKGRLKVMLLEKYIASSGSERQRLLIPSRGAMENDIDSILLNYTERPRRFDSDSKLLTLSAQCTINEGKIQQYLGGGAQVSPAGPSGTPKTMVCIFVARRQSKVQSKEAKVETGTQHMTSSEADADTAGNGSKVSTSANDTKSEVISSISSVTRTADAITYEIENNAKAGIDGAISQIFVERGFNIQPSSTLVAASTTGFDLDAIVSDFAHSSQFTQKNQALIARQCYNAGVDLVAFGTLTIGAQQRDPIVAGNVIVNVLVEGQVLDCSRLATTREQIDEQGIVVAPPKKYVDVKVRAQSPVKQLSQSRTSQTEAETAALELAATKVANILADQLQAGANR